MMATLFVCPTATFYGGVNVHPHKSAIKVRPTTHARQPNLRVRMEDKSHDVVPAPDVSDAAEELAQLLNDEHQDKVAKIFERTQAGAYLEERNDLVGQIGSAELLRRDEQEGFWPPELPKDPEAKAMLWVDEYSCIGCRWCASVARSTFSIGEEYGTASVVQQGGDLAEVVEEAIDVCPSDCIVFCTRNELEALEEYRDLHQNDMMARFYHGRRLAGEGDGGGSAAAPHWRDPIVHTSWRQGPKFVKTQRLKAELDDVLLHDTSSSTQSVAWAKDKPAVFPGTGANWPNQPAPTKEDI
jgi:ferredoxin